MKFVLNKDKLTIENEECLNSGAIQYYNAEVERDDSWDNLTIEARIVKKEDGRIEDVGNAIAVIGNSIYIDREINGTYAIGFIGYRIENEVKTYQISSNLVSVFFNQGAGELEVDNSQDVPTPSEWEIYIAQIEDLVNDLEGKIPTKYSDLINDNNTVQDANYVHTDNNYTTAEKLKLAGLENYNDTQVKQDIASLQTNKADKSEIPDVSEFITRSVNDLVYYYKKTETYTQAEVNSLIGAVSSLKIEIVQTLPTQDISTSTIYLVPKTASTNDNYDEYVYVSNNWEHIGSTKVDLTGYATEQWVTLQIADFLTETQIQTLLSGKVDKETGKGLSTNDYTDVDKDKVEKISNMMADLTATGTSIATTKSADWYGDLNVEGFSRQNTRSGKNQLNVPSTFSITGNIKKDLALGANTQYKVSFSSLDVGDGTVSLMSFLDSSNNQVASLVCTPSTLSYNLTPTSDVTSVRIYSRGSYNGSIDKTATYTNLMIRLASITDDTYEEYGVSPSPDYPSEIRNLEGKNLFDNNQTFEHAQYVDGVYYDSQPARVITDYIPIEYAQNYMIYCDLNNNYDVSLMNYNLFDKDKTWLGNRITNGDDNFQGLKQHAFSINIANSKYIRIVFRSYTSSTNQLSIDNVQNAEIQLEKGSTATEYAPYDSIRFTDKNSDNTKEYIVDFPLQEGQKLYDDSILTENGIQHLRNQLILNGTETISWDRTYNKFNIQIPLEIGRGIKNSAVKCNYFSSISNNDTGFQIVIGNGIAYIWLFDKNNVFESSTTKFKEYLSNLYANGTPVVVEYKLNSPDTDGIIPYTEAQQEAYNKLKEFPTYQGVNNISLVANEEATMTLNYKKDIQMQMQEELEEKADVSDIEKLAGDIEDLDDNKLNKTDIVVISQADYDDLETKEDKLYLIPEEEPVQTLNMQPLSTNLINNTNLTPDVIEPEEEEETVEDSEVE